ncbi:MAG TPA: glutamate formimidoyltransferase [Thermoanaerobaculia bacterium]|nr:glutamate formimidoyltransferase [Thermoanaerobaculia bacterium]HQN06991.1 glutamate formimidoyltransferase [Thermoanaerobaculia bacterium]HQP84973.1 glutamate formimidoyltransferase [Thermoanaerobaculia bacterium]
MSQIISVVPNICEGRDEAFVAKVQERLETVPGLVVLDVSMDQVRNRTIFSFTGSKEAIFQGGYLLYEEALGKIDMRQHEGEYPRIGAVDVFPFVALRDAPLPTVVDWSVQFAEEVAGRFALPVYLFAESARVKARRDIESIREGEYEGFAAKMNQPEWKPDFGPDVFPPDKGATIIGARLPIVNFKTYLATSSEEAAEWVSHVLSDPATGFSGVHFYPALDRTRNEALLNITVGNFLATPLYRILEAVKTELRRFGTRVSRVEMVGLVPQQALVASAEHYLQIFGFSADDVVENRLDAIFFGKD